MPTWSNTRPRLSSRSCLDSGSEIDWTLGAIVVLNRPMTGGTGRRARYGSTAATSVQGRFPRRPQAGTVAFVGSVTIPVAAPRVQFGLLGALEVRVGGRHA